MTLLVNVLVSKCHAYIVKKSCAWCQKVMVFVLERHGRVSESHAYSVRESYKNMVMLSESHGHGVRKS